MRAWLVWSAWWSATALCGGGAVQDGLHSKLERLYLPTELDADGAGAGRLNSKLERLQLLTELDAAEDSGVARLDGLHSKLERLQLLTELDADGGDAAQGREAQLEGLYAKLERLELLTELDAVGDSGGGAAREPDARLEGLYAKLERLEMLTELEAGGGGEGARRLEMVAALAAAAPELRAEQLERLLADLRESAAPGAATAPRPTAVNYADDDDAEDGGRRDADAELEDYPLMDEVGWEEAAELKDAALRHWLFMQTAAACGEPAARAVCVQDVHPHAGSVYLPTCVLLHRCSSDTGCCLNSALSCAPLQSHLRVVRLPLC